MDRTDLQLFCVMMENQSLATVDGTREYFQRHSAVRHLEWPGRGLTVSRAGFGGYRISIGVPEHRAALEHALTSGINLIDTSSNYADGGSEELIGAVWRGLAEDGRLRREELVVISKGGYIQGSNLQRERIVAERGNPWSEVVELEEHLHHSISPDFLEDQIAQSLLRLDVEAIDCYLLHNPEYFLKWAEREGLDREEAQNQYRDRITRAFGHLGEEVGRGRIGSFGISSNTFVSDPEAYDHTSLDMAIEAAEEAGVRDHFAAVQMPANLIERGYRRLTDRTAEEDLLLLANRPFNAIVEGKLLRLADFPVEGEREDAGALDRDVAEFAELEKRLREKVARAEIDARQRDAAVQILHIGSALSGEWQDLGPAEAFADIIGRYFAPRLTWLQETIGGSTPDLAEYLDRVRDVLQRILEWHSHETNRRNRNLVAELAESDQTVAEPANGPITHIGLESLWQSGVDIALVGMRRSTYVEDILSALR